MRVIIVGCGKVGRALAKQLSEEKVNVVIIDKKPQVVQSISVMYDVMGIVGNGTSYSVLQEAGVERADVLIATTDSDEANLLCCVIAGKQPDCRTIARLRNPIYFGEQHFLSSELSISMIVNQDQEAAREIARLLRFPNAIGIDTFSRERTEMLRFRVPDDSVLINLSVREIAAKLRQDILICIAEKNGEIIIPRGDYVVEKNDILTVITMPYDVEQFFRKVGLETDRSNNCIIIGGGSIAFYLTHMLLDSRVAVKIVERNPARCGELVEEFPKAIVECGNGSKQAILEEERLESYDALVACTGIDEINAVISKYAQSKVHKKVVTKLSHNEFNEVFKSLQLDSVIDPKEITVRRILQYTRAMEAGMNSNVETLYRLMNGKVEALEFVIQPGSEIAGISIMDMKIKPDTLIGGIVREGKLIIPGGKDAFMEGDSVIVVTTQLGFKDIRDILV
ncbi:MAG: Trk system potassium transporter TrkA [Eubacterium sp.]|nr:Trk system potassium transporter TrkA [Eubacterium sp.]